MSALDVASASTVEEANAEALVLSRGHADLDAPITGGEMAVLYRLANGLAKSGFFKDAKDANQAFAKLIFGRDLGLSATQALTDIYIVEGKPEMSANLQAAKVRSSDRYEYRIVELTDDRCEITFTQHGEVLHPSSVFTAQDAARAGLADKGVWKKYKRNMLFARALSNGVAFHCPDIMNGIRVYAEGEIAAEASTTAAVPRSESLVTDATVVEDGELLSDEARAALVADFEEHGVQIDLVLTALSIEGVEAVTAPQAETARAKLAEILELRSTQEPGDDR